jgi:mono/diheme cytochrome c family protein
VRAKNVRFAANFLFTRIGDLWNTNTARALVAFERSHPVEEPLMRTLKVPAFLFTSWLLVAAGCGSGANTNNNGGAGGHGGSTGGATGSAGHGGTGGSIGGTGGSAGGTGGSAGGSSGGAAAGTGGATGGTGGSAGAAGTGGGAGTGGQGGQGGQGGSTAGTGGGAGAAGHGGGSAGTGGAGGGTAGAGGSAGAAGTGGSVGGSGGATAGTGGGAGAGGTGGVAVDPVVARGQYLVTNVLGCAGCHTPQGGALLSGTDCFVKSGTTGCLSSANLTNDPSGLMNFTDQQIKDAFRKGIDPADSTKFLFANMPYYQFGTLTDTDASAIVAYLRTVPGVSHTVQAPTAPFDVQPAAAEWAAVDPTALPSAGSAAGPANGKYLATLACATCHTVNAAGTPTHIDAAKAFQGGKIVTTTVSGASKMVQTSNLTPDATGLMTWNVSQVAAAITTAKDKNGTAICGMRALANMTASDAIDIGTYLLSIPAVANTITMTCQ